MFEVKDGLKVIRKMISVWMLDTGFPPILCFKLRDVTSLQLVAGYWLLVTGCWLLVTGYWILVTGYWLLVLLLVINSLFLPA
jgi:hypothetical protein